jgi:hypothetical protein
VQDSWRWTAAGRRDRIYQSVVATLNFRVMLVARDQQKGMSVTIWEYSGSGDLPAIVYENGRDHG